MRSWGNRPDTFVCDEPLYAHYLQQTGLGHPGRDEVIAHHETDWHKVVDWLIGDVPEGKSIFYQKHMAHHLLPGIDRDWLTRLSHCFLIRDPLEMLTSLIKRIPEPNLEDTGLPQQIEVMEYVEEQTGKLPVVIDSRDVLENPGGMLKALCEALDVPYTDQMLEWPAGRRETDGIWAKHWYDAVEQTTGFGAYSPKGESIPEHLENVLASCNDCYRVLYDQRLTVS
jgi:hypothetical protein